MKNNSTTQQRPSLEFTQVAWVVKDIEKAKRFFKELIGIDNFSPTAISRFKEYDATYYGEPCDAETLFSMAYSDGSFIELIQPLSGKTVFHDYIEHKPTGGVQHIAYSTPIEQLDSVIADFENKGFPIISSFNTPIAKIVFFDTRKEIGMMTEIMGITSEGETAIKAMKGASKKLINQ